MCHPGFLDLSPSPSPSTSSSSSFSSLASSYLSMDSSCCPQPTCEDPHSLQPRSRAPSQVSTTAAQLLAIQLAETPRSLCESSFSIASAPFPSSGYSHSAPSASSSSSPLPFQEASRNYSPPAALLQSIFDADWSQQQRNEILDSTPLVRVNPTGESSQTTTPSSSPPPGNASMSTVAAISFDPTFAMGTRSPFAWPGFDHTTEAANSYLGPDMTLGPASDASLSPPTGSRSITASPPRGTLTPEQRELKRQRDQARRDSKARARRAGSNPYINSPPLSMPDVSAAMGVPVYTTAPAPISLLAEPTTTMATPSYLASYSPPLPDATGYQAGYQSLAQNYNLGVDYSAPFQPSAQYSRPPSMQVSHSDPSMLYGVPPTMATGTGPADHGPVRVVQSRPKPQCWEHGCNGRQFSTFSNLLRHQREKSGQAAKATCPNCGAEFTRTTARNGHLLHDKCKRRNT